MSELPRENLVRVMTPGDFEVREANDGHTLVGHFTKYNEWTQITERGATFMERIAPNAFMDSFARQVPKPLFQHGMDPSLGDQVLGKVEVLREDPVGPYYEVALFRGIPELVLDGLRNGAYGASFRFGVRRENVDHSPEASDYNPDALPERTIEEADVAEFGPVTFPAYAGATAGIRSMTDADWMSHLIDDPKRLASLIAAVDEMRSPLGTADLHPEQVPAPAPEPAPAPLQAQTPSEPTLSGPPPAVPTQEESMQDLDRFSTVDDLNGRATEVQARLNEIGTEYGVRSLPSDVQAEFDDLGVEKQAIAARLKVVADRMKVIGDHAADPTIIDTRIPQPYEPAGFRTNHGRVPENIYDLDGYRVASRSVEDHLGLLRDGAMRSIEGATFAHAPDRERAQGRMERLLKTVDYEDEGKRGGELAERVLQTGSPLYRKAFRKYLNTQGQMGRLTPDEQRALSVGTTTAGGFAIVYDLDPTLVHTSNSSVNPYRAISRDVTIAGTNEWRQPTSGAVTAAYAAEATEASDNAPTLAQAAITVEKAQAYVPFSIEVGQDWGELDTEVGRLFAEAKDDLEATKFTLGAGHGSQEPKGIITAATATTTAGGTAAFAIADLYKVFEALPPRFRPNARWLANLFTLDKVRQFDTAGGSGVWVDNLQAGTGGIGFGAVGEPAGPGIIGRRAYECTSVAAALTTGTKIAVIGDFSHFVIVDRVGMNVEFLPLVVGTNHRPTGQRGLYAYWRNSSDVDTAAAFQVLVTG